MTFEGRVQRMEGQVPRPSDMDDVSRPSSDEVFELLLGERIDEAEQRGDWRLADMWRKSLDEGIERTVERFLNIDEMSIPPAGDALVQKVKEAHVIYSLSRIMYLHERASIGRSRDNLFIDDYQTMFRWLEHYG